MGGDRGVVHDDQKAALRLPGRREQMGRRDVIVTRGQVAQQCSQGAAVGEFGLLLARPMAVRSWAVYWTRTFIEFGSRQHEGGARQQAIAERPAIRRHFIQIGQRPLLDTASREDEQLIGKLAGLRPAVRDVQRRQTGALLDRSQQLAQPVARRFIQGVKRLVQQQNLRPKRQRPAQGPRAALAAAEAMHVAAQEFSIPSSRASSATGC